MLAVQVVNYRTRGYLERCLATVATDVARCALDYEINLLDNDSGENLDDLAAGIAFCRAFVAPSNLGFGAGHNLLATNTAAQYLLILNPDVELLVPGTIKRLLDQLRSDPAIKVIGPKLLNADGGAQPYDHGELHGLRAQISLRGGHSYWRETFQREEVAWVSGAAMLIDRAAFDAVGGFDENLFLYKEDEDLCLRLREARGIVVYEPAEVIRHQGSVVTHRPAELATASSYFIQKHFPNSHTQRLFAAVHRWLPYLGFDRS
jgi:N-acetylglucosaminyl-diphospho-decaprenol L-rhamnosyltransferase